MTFLDSQGLTIFSFGLALSIVFTIFWTRNCRLSSGLAIAKDLLDSQLWRFLQMIFWTRNYERSLAFGLAVGVWFGIFLARNCGGYYVMLFVLRFLPPDYCAFGHVYCSLFRVSCFLYCVVCLRCWISCAVCIVSC